MIDDKGPLRSMLLGNEIREAFQSPEFLGMQVEGQHLEVDNFSALSLHQCVNYCKRELSDR